MIILVGFILLLLLLLGVALFLLALVFLGVSVGIQLLGFVAGSSAAWIPTLATNVQLASASAFGLGVVLALVGLAAFLIPAVRTFVKGLILLFRIALSPVFTQLLHDLPQALATIASLLETTGKLIIDPTTAGHPNQEPLDENQPLKVAGQTMVDGVLPNVTTWAMGSEPLWLDRDGLTRRAGYVPLPSLPPTLLDQLPHPNIAIDPIESPPVPNPVKAILVNSGNVVIEAGNNAVDVGKAMRNVAGLLNETATLIRQATQ